MHIESFSSLEPRLFLSGSKMTVDPAAVAAAKAAVMSSFTLLQEHYAANKSAVDAAKSTMRTHQRAADVVMAGLRAEYRSEQAAFKVALNTAKADLASVKSIWTPIIAAGVLDVNTDSEGETAEERAADLEKLAADRETYADARSAAQAAIDDTRAEWYIELDGTLAAMADASDAARAQRRVDAMAVKSAQRTLVSVFQSDKVILADAMDDYRAVAGKSNTLKLPKLPCV